MLVCHAQWRNDVTKTKPFVLPRNVTIRNRFRSTPYGISHCLDKGEVGWNSILGVYVVAIYSNLMTLHSLNQWKLFQRKRSLVVKCRLFDEVREQVNDIEFFGRFFALYLRVPSASLCNCCELIIHTFLVHCIINYQFSFLAVLWTQWADFMLTLTLASKMCWCEYLNAT